MVNYQAVNPVVIAKRVKQYVIKKGEEEAFSRIDDFIFDWFSTITPGGLGAALASGADPTVVLLDEEFKADIWRRVPFFADSTIYKQATEERIRYYVTERIPEKLVVEYPEMLPYWEAIKPHQEEAIVAVRKVLKALFD